MINMGSISIFSSLNFSGTPFAISRSFDGVYILKAGDFVVTMTPDGARALAEGGARIRTKAEVAAYFRRELTAGRAFARDLLAVDGRTVHLSFGISDAGDVYLEIGAGRMTLTDQQAALLLAVLDQLGADVSAISRASEGPAAPDFGVARGLRGFAIRIPGGDDEWV
jgi:hypothetical protein